MERIEISEIDLVKERIKSFLPFIIRTLEKVTGSAVEKKWQMMKDSIMTPRKQ